MPKVEMLMMFIMSMVNVGFQESIRRSEISVLPLIGWRLIMLVHDLVQSAKYFGCNSCLTMQCLDFSTQATWKSTTPAVTCQTLDKNNYFIPYGDEKPTVYVR